MVMQIEHRYTVSCARSAAAVEVSSLPTGSSSSSAIAMRTPAIGSRMVGHDPASTSGLAAGSPCLLRTGAGCG